MNAKDYGVPQNRSRWYCIGFRRDLGVSFSETIDKQVKKASNVFYFPSECKLTISLSDIIDKNGKCKTVHEKFLTQHDNGRGYLFVNLWKNNKCKKGK